MKPALLGLIAAAPAPRPAPVEVMIVGDFHMGNPGQNLHDVQVHEVLAPRRQAEIARVTAALARFRLTAVAVERPATTPGLRLVEPNAWLPR